VASPPPAPVVVQAEGGERLPPEGWAEPLLRLPAAAVSAVDCRHPTLRTIPPGSHRLLAVDPPPRSTKPGRRLPIPLLLVLKQKGARLPRRRNVTTTARSWADMPDLRRVNDDVLAL
jgi:hypothetical protein